MTNNIQRSLGRIEGKVDGINKHLEKMNGAIDDHTDKIDKLETFKDQTEGAKQETKRIASIGGAIAGGFVTAVIWIASKLFKN